MLKQSARWIQLLDYIDAHADERLTTALLCQQLHLSTFHFHRQFNAYFGVNLADYIQQVRFVQASHLLAYRNNLSITHISLAVGFEHAEVFSRAFKRWSGMSPRTFREAPPWAFMQDKSAQLNQLRSLNMPFAQQHYNVELIEFRAVNIAILSHQGAPAGLGASIQRFIAWRKAHNLPPSRARTFNIIYTSPDVIPAEDFRLDLAVEYSLPVDSTDGIQTEVIEGGLCARLCYEGDEAGLGAAVDYLYRCWLSENPYQVRHAPLFFERLLMFPDVAANQAQTHIYLPLVAN